MDSLLDYSSDDETSPTSSSEQLEHPAKRPRLQESNLQPHSGPPSSPPRYGTTSNDSTALVSNPTNPNNFPGDQPSFKLPSAADLFNGSLPDTQLAILEAAALPKPDRHQGRVRNFQHVDGNFATVVYIPLEINDKLLAPIQQAFDAVKRVLPSSHPMIDGLEARTDVHAQPSTEISAHHATSAAPYTFPLHISLSRTVPIRAGQTPTLISALQNQLAKPFGNKPLQTFNLKGFESYVNDQNNRTFAAMEVREGKEAICALVAAVDKAFRQHGLQVFYEDPRPHVSFAWSLDNVRDKMLTALQQAGGDAVSHPPVQCVVGKVLCRVGQKDYVVWPKV